MEVEKYSGIEKKPNIFIWNLDGNDVLCVLDSDIWYNQPSAIPKKLEETLGIPKEEQVYYFYKERWHPDRSNRAEKILNLGCKPLAGRVDVLIDASEDHEDKRAGNSFDAGEIPHEKINGSYAKVIILNRFNNGEEVVDRFNMKLASTYFDLKIYLLEQLDIDTSMQVILRRNGDNYVQRNDDEPILNYVFAESLIPKQNIVYLFVKGETSFFHNDIRIQKLKSITICSNKRKDITRLLTITPEDNHLLLFKLKHEIEKQLGLPLCQQIIYHNENACNLEYGSIVDPTIQDIINNYFDSDGNELILNLTADCRGDPSSAEICKEYGINCLEVMIKTPSGDLITKQYATPDSRCSSFKTIIENNYNIPSNLQVLYHDLEKVVHSEFTFECFKGPLLSENCELHLLVMKDLVNDQLDEICRNLSIPQVSPEIACKSMNDLELCKINLDQTKNESLWFSNLKREIADYLDLPVDSLYLFFDKEELQDDNAIVKRLCNWKSLYFTGGVVREEIMFNLAFKLSIEDQKVKNFCEENGIPLIKSIKVNLLTSELEINIFERKKDLTFISDVKNCIYEMKNIPPFAQEIFINGKVLEDSENLVNIFFQEYSNQGFVSTMDFTVVVKKVDDVQVFLRFPFPSHFNIPQSKNIMVPGGETVFKIKEELERLTGSRIKTDQIALEFDEAGVLPDDTFVYYVIPKRCSKVKIAIATLWKVVTVSITNKDGAKTTEKHNYHSNQTIEDFVNLRLNTDDRQFVYIGKIPKSRLMYDLNGTDIVEVKDITGGKSKSCKLM